MLKHLNTLYADKEEAFELRADSLERKSGNVWELLLLLYAQCGRSGSQIP